MEIDVYLCKMAYDPNKILDIDCESFINEGVTIPTIFDIVTDLQKSVSHIDSVINVPKYRKTYTQYQLDNMNIYSEYATAIIYFINERAIPGKGKEWMQRFVPKLQNLAQYDQNYLAYLELLK